MIGISSFYIFSSALNLYFIISISTLIFFILIGINIFYKSIRAYRFKYFTGILFCLLFYTFGGGLSLLNNETLKHSYFEKINHKQLKVWINDEPQIRNGIIRFTANVTTAYNQQQTYSVSGKLLITIKTDTLNSTIFNYGEELILTAACTPIIPPFNPGEFDFKNWLASKNVNMQAFIPLASIIKTKLTRGNPILKYALKLRKSQVKVYEKLISDKEAFAVASTLILGYRSDLSSDTLTSYSKTGTIHALSVSGMHVGIIYVVLNWILSFMNRNQWLKILKVIIICILIWFYSLLTGFSPSVLRSAIMLTVYILAKTFNKNTNGYNILAFTAFCLLIYDPFLIWDVGFQLSFLAVLGLIYLQPKIYKWIYLKQRWADWIWSSVALSVAAQFTTFPLSIYYFHQFPVYFIFSNLFILIPITLLMYLGISIILFKAYFLTPIFEWLICFMNDGLKWIADLPFSGVNQIWINKIQLTLLIVGLIFCLIALSNYKKKLLFISLLLLLIFQSSLSIKIIHAKKQKKIIFFTLQKGYAAAFINSQEAVLVSNFNSKDKNFQFYVLPALHQFHINNIKFVEWEVDTTLKRFIKKNKQIYFNGFRILLLDKYLNHKVINNIPFLNTVWIHNNPKHKLVDLQKSVIFKSLIVDASNSTYTIKEYLDEANKLQIDYHILKKNKAYLIDLINPHQ